MVGCYGVLGAIRESVHLMASPSSGDPERAAGGEEFLATCRSSQDLFKIANGAGLF